MPYLRQSLFVCCLLSFGVRALADESQPKTINFDRTIRPILSENCFKCHGDVKKHKGELRLDSRSGMLTGGDQGPAIEPGHPDKSLLVKAINWTDDFKMPPDKKLTREQVADLAQWVKLGAPWPGGDKVVVQPKKGEMQVTDKDRQHWAFRAIKKPAAPAVKKQAWVSE